MSLIRVGSTSRYADGWEAVFGGGKATARKKGRKAAAAKPAKKTAKKSVRKATKKAVTKARKPGKSRRG